MNPMAVLRIRPAPHYRREAFIHGLLRAGYLLQDEYMVFRDHPRLTRNDVMLTWNYVEQVKEWTLRGGTVLVAENGYIGRDTGGVQLYALARDGHNGSGRWPDGGPERWRALNIEVKPWRAPGAHIVVRGQRGIGSPTMASPPQWHDKTALDLAAYTRRFRVIQRHPGKPANDPAKLDELLAGLENAWAMCIWSSAAGVRALVEGVPVIYCAPHWICEGAAVRGIENIEHPKRDDAARLAALQRMAWAQWTIEEIASGEPFALLRELE